MKNKNSILNGLVLTGGKSTRMGYDKSAIKWHGEEQKYYLIKLLQPYCINVFISCRKGQLQEKSCLYKSIEDSTEGGALGAIVTAFDYCNTCAWLVVACDLPFLDDATINYLLKNRNTSSNATAFISPFDGLPEPLITLWEPGSFNTLVHKQKEGKTCPRKALINSKVHLIIPPNPTALTNANTKDDVKKINPEIYKMLFDNL
ncbi:MAG TPA: NTP transferase domain-containing protein [Chitinophagaceae bacterium]|nr:NTP transferase domain-containing protein [Chitinophagaceae bacterium]